MHHGIERLRDESWPRVARLHVRLRDRALVLGLLLCAAGWASHGSFALAREADFAARADRLQALGDSLITAGAYTRADSVLQLVVGMRRDTADSDPLALANALASRGRARKNLADLGTAEAALREALDIQRQQLGSEHPDVAASLYQLAMTLDRGNAAQREASLVPLRECLQIREHAFGQDSKIVLKTRVALAMR
jgi:Tetratricopeptide repeat